MLLGECPDHPIGTYFDLITKAGAKAGRPLIIGRGIKKRMEEVGFVDIVERTAIWPLGPWPKDKRLKELGKWGKLGAVDSAYPFAVQLLTREGWTVEQVKELCEKVYKDLEKGKYYCHG